MYKKILAPLDGSELSECTLGHIRAVATGCQVPEVVLLYVVAPVDDGGMHYRHRGLSEDAVREGETKDEAYGKDYLAKMADRLKKEGLAVETAVVQGMPAEEILDYAGKNEADLIIISTHGRSGVSRWAFGSVADKVIRHSTVPILVVAPHGCRI